MSKISKLETLKLRFETIKNLSEKKRDEFVKKITFFSDNDVDYLEEIYKIEVTNKIIEDNILNLKTKKDAIIFFEQLKEQLIFYTYFNRSTSPMVVWYKIWEFEAKQKILKEAKYFILEFKKNNE